MGLWTYVKIYLHLFFLAPKTKVRKIERVGNECYHNKVLIRFPVEVKSWMISFNDVLKKISFFTESPRPPCYGRHFHRCSRYLGLRRWKGQCWTSEHFFLWGWSWGCDLCRNLRMKTEPSLCDSKTLHRHMLILLGSSILVVPRNQQSRTSNWHYFWFRDQCLRTKMYFNSKKLYKLWMRIYKMSLDLLLQIVAAHWEKKPSAMVLEWHLLWRKVAWCEPVLLRQLASLKKMVSCKQIFITCVKY